MVTRYYCRDDIDAGVGMIESSRGDYVEYSDYEELEEALGNCRVDLKEAQDKYDTLVESIRDLYRNA